MSKWEDIHKIVSDIEHERDGKIKPVNDEYNSKRDIAIHNFLNFKVGQMLKYNCSGSGYIGRYMGIENQDITLCLCNKSGISKGKIFKCYYGDFEKLEIL